MNSANALRPTVDSILGCLIGLASGDAMGMPTEFLTPRQIIQYYGHVDGFVEPHREHIHAGMPAGAVTDDTGQAIALAHAAIQAGGRLSPVASAAALLAWADSMGARFEQVAGPSTRRALSLIRRGVAPEQSGRDGTTNGAAMRAPVAGLLHSGNFNAAIQAAYAVSLPTHGTNIAISGACAVACATAEAVVPRSTLDTILSAAMQGAERGAEMGRVIWGISLCKRIELGQRLVERAENESAALQALYDYVGVDILVSESVATALGIVRLALGDPVKAILMSANLGGDADTIGAIAGAVCGAWKGARAFPSGWGETLDQVNHFDLRLIAEKLAGTVATNIS
jgi:ADP-ribosylglycohydrolase